MEEQNEEKVSVSLEELIDMIIEKDDEHNEKQSRYQGRDNLTLPDPCTEQYYIDDFNRTLWLESEIDEHTIALANEIIRYNIEDTGKPVEERKPITLYINSPGGLLDISMAICDAISMSKTPIVGVNIGCAASGAALIYASCPTRKAMPNASFLLHLGTGGTWGTYQQTKQQQADYDYRIERLKDIFYNNLTIDNKENFEKLIDGEWYLYATDKDENSEHNAHKIGLINSEFSWS